MRILEELRSYGRMTWLEAEQGWMAAPDEVVSALSQGGFAECKREETTSRRDSRPAGGVWQGLDTRTGAVASAVWVNRLLWPQAIVFITVDGEPFRGDGAGPEAGGHHDDGGEA